ncbi:hypothetical protein KUTeg_013071, partial [Tegillarca granosa]
HVKTLTLSDHAIPSAYGLKPVKEWNVYSLPQCPVSHSKIIYVAIEEKKLKYTNQSSFMFITNPFQDGYHTYWLKRCVCDYPDKPNITNLDPHICREDIGNLWKYSQKSSRNDVTSKETIGFHNFTSEAAIVNYYHMNSTLAGHTDHSEFDHTAPLISISFGQDAIFLLGGETKATKPLAMFLHSGDICVMSGQSRLCYHAIPRILQADKSRLAVTFDEDVTKFCNTNLQETDKQEKFEENEELQCVDINSLFLFQYLNSTRINVNVRQVLRPGGEFPASYT